MKRTARWMVAALIAAMLTAHAAAQVPQLLNYQGRITVGGTNFTGTGQFQFALVNDHATQTYWSNGTGTVSVPVSKGLYTVLLGNAMMANMAVLPSTVFTNSDMWLRVWFDGQQLSPDRRIAAVGYAMMAGNVPDGAITSAKIATGAVGTAQLASNAVTSNNIADGAVGTAQLAANAIQASNIASNTITAAQLAPGSVGATQLAKPPQSGSIAFTTEVIHFDQINGAVTFSPAFNTIPNVTLSLETTDWSLSGTSTLFLMSKTTTDFAFRWAALPPTTPVTADTDGDIGAHCSLAVVNGNPAISYYNVDNGNLKYVRASDASGTSWNTPVGVDTTGDVGQYTSLAVVNGNPAISYYDVGNDNLKFVRASNANGTSWDAPFAVDNTGDVGWFTSLAVVNKPDPMSAGNPAISYYDSINGDLKYISSASSSGFDGSWETPIAVDSTGNVGQYTSLAVVNSNPAISYYDLTTGNLKYVRASNAAGTSWGTPVAVDTPGNVGLYTSLTVVNGNPAISYYDLTNGDLKYVRATDANGTNWATAVSVDTPGNVGLYTSLVVVNGNPAISYYHVGSGNLKYVRATDADGTSWGIPVSVDTPGNVGQYTSLKIINDQPAISCYDQTNGDLKFIRQSGTNSPPPFTVNWIALEP